MHTDHHELHLAFGFTFQDLYSRDGLTRLDAAFCHSLGSADTALRQHLIEARKLPEALSRRQQSELMIAIAPHLEDFIGELFGITGEVRALQARHEALAPIYTLKRKFIQKKAMSGVPPEKPAAINGLLLAGELEGLFGEPLTQASFVEHVSRWLDSEAEHTAQLALAAQYGAWAALSAAGRHKHRHDVLFRVPHKLDMQHLVPVETLRVHGHAVLALPEQEWRHREGFNLTDAGMNLTAALDQAHYCIKCHHQGKDSCSTGLKEKEGPFKHSVFGVTLAGR